MSYIHLACLCLILTTVECSGLRDDVCGRRLPGLVSKVFQLPGEVKKLKDRIEILEGKLASPGCPEGWIQFESSCYGIGDDTITWGAAQGVCQLFDATLAEVETAAENEFLKEIARSRNYDNMWLGGTDIFSEGNFIWAGSKTAVNFTDWGQEEPNDGGNEDCVHFWKAKGYTWNDAECYLNQNFACEIKMEEF